MLKLFLGFTTTNEQYNFHTYLNYFRKLFRKQHICQFALGVRLKGIIISLFEIDIVKVYVTS